MADKLITIGRFTDYGMASLAKQILEDNEIKAVLTGYNATNIYGGIASIAETKLEVLESQAEKATQILESMQEQEQ